MSITTSGTTVNYAGAGTTGPFTVNFPFQLSTDLLVQLYNNTTGISTTLTLNADYSVTGGGSPAATGTVTTNVAVASGTSIFISRSVPLTQLTSWQSNDAYPANFYRVENGLDKLTMAMQGLSYYFGRSWYLPFFGIDGQSYFDARNNRGANLGDPENPQDAVTLSYMTAYINALIAAGSGTAPLDYQFIGTGAQTAYTLAGANVPLVTAYFVTLDGVNQLPTADFTITISPTPQIIFTTAPPAGCAIDVRVLGYAQPITTGIDGSAITSGIVSPPRLGNGLYSSATFLRGDSTWSNTLIGGQGGTTLPTSSNIIADFQNNLISAIRVAGGASGQAGYWFGAAASANAYDAAWIYDQPSGTVGFYGGATSTLWHQFNAFSGTVSLGSGALFVDPLNQRVSVPGTFFGFNITGNADGSIITSGQISPARLASNAPTAGYVLGSAGLWVPQTGGAGGGNTTTTATFVMAAVNSTQTVTVASVTTPVITVGASIYVSDGTHTLQGIVTGIASLNLTVQTTVINAGVAGNTMANSATVGLGPLAGNSAILIADAGTGAAALSTLTFSGKTANVPAAGYQVDLYVASNSGGNATIKGYLNSNLRIGALTAASGPATDQLGWLQSGTTTWGTINAGASGTVLQSNGTALSFAQINAANSLVPGTIPANLLQATNSPTNGYFPAYDNATGKFTWTSPAASGGVPVGGTAAQLLRGDGTWNNAITSASSSPGTLLQLINTGTNTITTSIYNNWGVGMEIIHASALGGSPDQTLVTQFANPLVGLTAPIGYPNFSLTSEPEAFITSAYMHAGGYRSSTSGYWLRVNNQASMTSTFTIDIESAAYYRLTGFTANCTFTITDTSPSPTGSQLYCTQCYIEIVAPGSFTVSWPGNVTWANGSSAPTLSTTGTTLVRLIRRQGQTQWIGIVEAVSGSSYTDAQARAAVFNGAQFPNSSSINWTIVTGSSGSATPSIASGGVTNAMLAGSIAISKLAVTGTPSSTTALFGDGTWKTVTGGGGTTSPLTTKGDLWGYSTTNARVPIGTDGQVLVADSTQSLGLKWASLPGGTFSPGTSYTWTAGQAFNGANTHGNTVLHSVNFPANFTLAGTPTVATLGTGGLADGSLGTHTPIYSHVDNHAPNNANLSLDYASQVNAGTFWHSMYNPGQGCNSLYNILDIRGNMTNVNPGAANFHLAFTSQVCTRQMNKTNGNGTADAVWLVACSPDIFYQSSPDNQGIKHSFGAGTVRIGEVNYGNLWADFGLQETRGFARSVVGLEFFPDALPGAVTGSSPINKIDVQYAISIGTAGAGGNGQSPRNWVGALIDQNAIVPGGYALRLWGSNGNFTGNNGTQNAATNAPAAIIKMSGTTKTGIDFAGTQNDATILTCTNTGAPVITMTDATQSIKLGSVWIRGNGGHLQYSTNGSTWTNIV